MDKVESIKAFQFPKNLRELSSFIGMTGYYRPFVRNYSKIAAPLTDLLKKLRCMQWSQEAQDAFDTLKHALLSAPILALPHDDESTFILDTDASDFAAGAVLSQIQDGKEHVISYASRILIRQSISIA